MVVSPTSRAPPSISARNRPRGSASTFASTMAYSCRPSSTAPSASSEKGRTRLPDALLRGLKRTIFIASVDERRLPPLLEQVPRLQRPDLQGPADQQAAQAPARQAAQH